MISTVIGMYDKGMRIACDALTDTECHTGVSGAPAVYYDETVVHDAVNNSMMISTATGSVGIGMYMLVLMLNGAHRVKKLCAKKIQPGILFSMMVLYMGCWIAHDVIESLLVKLSILHMGLKLEK